MCSGAIWNFLYWHLEDLMITPGGDIIFEQYTVMKTIQGLSSGVHCLCGQIPLFFVSGWLLKRIGPIHAMSVVMICLGFELFSYSFLSNPWWVLPIECLSGATFSILYTTMVSYANDIAPNGSVATLQV